MKNLLNSLLQIAAEAALLPSNSEAAIGAEAVFLCGDLFPGSRDELEAFWAPRIEGLGVSLDDHLDNNWANLLERSGLSNEALYDLAAQTRSAAFERSVA